MKNFTTFQKALCASFLFILATNAALAQNSLDLHRGHSCRIAAGTHIPVPHAPHFSSNPVLRSLGTCDSSFNLDYSNYCNQAAIDEGLQYVGLAISGGTIEVGEITSFIDTFHNYESYSAFQYYDSMVYVDQNDNLLNIPLAQTGVYLDSLNLWMALTGDTLDMLQDSLVFTVYQIQGGYPWTPSIVQTVVLSGSEQLFPLVVGQDQVINYTLPIGYQFPEGAGFGIGVNYRGKDTSTHFYLGYTFADSCGQDYAAYTPNFPYYAGGYQIEPVTGYDSATAAYYNNTYSYSLAGVPQNCLWIFEQNWYIVPIITLCTPYWDTVSVLSVTLGANQTVCTGSSIILNPSVFGGYPPYNYQWSASGNALSCSDCAQPTASMSQNSIYTLTVTDASFQTATASVSYTVTPVGQSIGLTVSNTIINCSNPVDTATLSVTGNASLYTFNWGDGTILTGLSPQTHYYTNAGVQVISVSDSIGCITSIFDTVPDQGLLITLNQVTQPECNGYTTGQLSVSVTGGTPPYAYDWNNGATTDSISNLFAASYELIVNDANSCSASFFYGLIG